MYGTVGSVAPSFCGLPIEVEQYAVGPFEWTHTIVNTHKLSCQFQVLTKDEALQQVQSAQ